MIDPFEPYTDIYDCIVGSKEDPGDSLHRNGMRKLGAILRGHAMQPISFFLMGGIPIRHHSDGWWSEACRTSRDQVTPLLAIGDYGDLWKLLIRRGGFFWNTRRNGATKENHGQVYKQVNGRPVKRNYNWKLPDWAGPNTWALYFRYKGWQWPLYICDTFLFFNAISRRFTTDRDPNNYLVRTRYAQRKNRTFWIGLIDRIEDKEKLDADLHYYYQRVGLMPMYDLWRELI